MDIPAIGVSKRHQGIVASDRFVCSTRVQVTLSPVFAIVLGDIRTIALEGPLLEGLPKESWQELWWLVDTTVISCLESGCFGKMDFFRMDNYVLRLGPEAAKRLIDALRIKFNSPVRYAGKLYGWDTVMRLKAQVLANHALGKRIDLDFSKPKPALHRTDSEAIRSRILPMTMTEARKLGIGRNTLSYLQRRADSDRPFAIYSKVRRRILLR